MSSLLLFSSHRKLETSIIVKTDSFKLWASCSKANFISANQGLNSPPGILFFCSKQSSWIIFCIFFRASYHQIAGKKFNLIYFLVVFKFRTTGPGYYCNFEMR